MKPCKVLGHVEYDHSIMHMVFKKRADQIGKYPTGCFIMLNCPEINKREWHPFTVSSAVDEKHLSVTIRGVGDWTTRLHELMREDDYPEMYIDGPFYSPFVDYSHYETVVLVGLGIGVTPAMAVLKDFVVRRNNGTQRDGGTVKKIYLYVIAREGCATDWISAEIAHYMANPEIHVDLDVAVYYTAPQDVIDALLFHVGHEIKYRSIACEATSGSRTMRPCLGRPNWSVQLNRIEQQNPDTNATVLYCGAPGPGKLLRHACVEANKVGKGKSHFDFRMEHWEPKFW
jgi:NAD(P)H-flavin reductase